MFENQVMILPKSALHIHWKWTCNWDSDNSWLDFRSKIRHNMSISAFATEIINPPWLHDTSLTTDEESLKIHSEMMISQFFFSIPRFFLLKSPIFVGELHGKFPRKKISGFARIHARSTSAWPRRLHPSQVAWRWIFPGNGQTRSFFPLGIELGIYLKVS
jgi:hypothetical protein